MEISEDAPRDVAQDLAFGARAARALFSSSPCHHHRRRHICAARAEMGAQLGNSVVFGSGCGCGKELLGTGDAAQIASMLSRTAPRNALSRRACR